MNYYQELVTHIDNFNLRLSQMVEISKLPVKEREVRYRELLGQEPKFDRAILVPVNIKNRISNELGIKALQFFDGDIFLKATLRQVVIAKKSMLDLVADPLFNHNTKLMNRCKKDLEAYEKYSRVSLPKIRNWLDSIKTSSDFKALCETYGEINREYLELMTMSQITDVMTLEVMTSMGYC